MGRRGQIGRQLMMWRGNGPTRNCPGCSTEPGDQEQKAEDLQVEGLLGERSGDEVFRPAVEKDNWGLPG